MPVLNNIVWRNLEGQRQHANVSGGGQVPRQLFRQGRDVVAAGNDRNNAEEAWDSQADVAPDLLGLESLLHNPVAGAGSGDRQVGFALILLHGDRLFDARMIGPHRAYEAVAEQALLAEARAHG